MTSEVELIIEIKGTINVMCLNHPETIPHLSGSMEKLSSQKSVPGAKKVGDSCSRASGLGFINSVSTVTLQNRTPVSNKNQL